MRARSPAVSKGQRSPNARLAPKEGSKLRRAFDLLMANKGVPIDVALTCFEGKRNLHRVVDDLQDYYGLDIRMLQPGKWVLAGEWFGKNYRDYIADRIAEFDRAQS